MNKQELFPRKKFKPTHGWVSLKLGELVEYHELLFFLTLRDIKVRYKQTVLGAAWAIIQPFFTMIVFSIFLGKLAKVPSDGLPYPIFTYTALLPWTLFANSLLASSNSLVTNQNLITKIYFPRLVIPISAVIGGVVDFAIALVVMLGMMLYYHIAPTIAIITLPLFVLFAVLSALSVGLWLSALNVQYRDVRYMVPFLTQFWMFASPIVYSASLVPEKWRMLYGLNPMVGVVEGFRWALLGTSNPSGFMLVSLGVTLVLLVGGLFYFRRMEKTFADMV